MRKNFKNTTSITHTVIKQAISTLVLAKPHLYLNSDGDILDCNQAFLDLINSSKTELLAFNLNEHKLNEQFINTLKEAETDGLRNYKGIIKLGRFADAVFLDAVLLKINKNEKSGNKIICLVIEFIDSKDQSKSDTDTIASVNTIANHEDVSISVHATDGKALYISSSIESLLGYTCDELMHIVSTDVVHPEDRHIVIDVLAKLSGGLNAVKSRYRMVHKNGTVVHIETSSYLISDESRAIKFIVNVNRDLGLQAKIEKALERSEQKYYRLVMNLPTGIALISTKGELIEVNDAMKQIMGILADSPIPKMNFFEIEAMKRTGIGSQLSKCIETKAVINGEITFKNSQQNPGKFLTYSFVPVLSPNNDVDVVIGYVSDHTQQVKAENESRERADFLNLVINTIKSPFFVKDEDHTWIMLNDAAVEMMGHSKEELVGKSDYDLYAKEQADVFWQFDELVFKTGSSSNEEQITWSDGTLHTIVTHKQLYVEKSTGKKFIVGTIHDVSSYKKIEDELRASELKYHELFDNANDFIITMDLEGNITNANRTLLNYLQTSLTELTSHSVYDFISKENLDLVNTTKERILTGPTGEAFEIEAFGAGGQPVTFEVKTSLIRQNGELAGVQCMFSDVTERREATLRQEKYTRDLLELNKTKDKFFSIIAHDLRNPFSSMIGFSEMALNDLDRLTKDEIRDSLKIIHTSAKNSFNLLDNLLAWSRLETGRMPFEPVPVILTDCVNEVIDVLFSNAYRKKIEINNLVLPETVIHADKNMLASILNNLIMNAIKYTPTGGEISIFASDQGSELKSGKEFIKVSVADTGIGMDTDTIEMLFSAYKLVSNPGTEKEQGTGLGLLLTREMIEKHGGRIRVESSPGKGSVFSLFLPAYQP